MDVRPNLSALMTKKAGMKIRDGAKQLKDVRRLERDLSRFESDCMTDSGKKCILIIDDDADMLKLLKVLLAGMGHEILTAERGAEGILKASRHRPDLILCDVVMPGMDGIEACRQIQQRFQDGDKKFIPVVMLTSQRTTDDVKSAVSVGAIDYMTKPFDPEKLAEKILNYLDPVWVAKRALEMTEARKKLQARAEE